ncbi:MAG: hypothetical protein KatS3mg081_1154 [Gemmatimonadales bacterium]|nr:MAG: hypothetical protein KatS3mg081_1154 [Gemmatimonadales bacterium]
MLRTLLGFAVLAVIAYVALKLLFGLLGFAISLFMTLLWLAAIGFVIYLVLKAVSPETARRVKEVISGRRTAA